MSNYGRELHKFILGETRTDGFKSDWRKEQERRRAEEMGKRQFVKMPEIKIVRPQNRKARPSRAKVRSNPGFTKSGVPSGMSNIDYNRHRRRMWRSQGLCGGCGGPVTTSLYSCDPCLERKASYYCKKMGKPYVVKNLERMSCKDCGKLLKSNNSYGYCRAHYRKRRRYLERAA